MRNLFLSFFVSYRETYTIRASLISLIFYFIALILYLFNKIYKRRWPLMEEKFSKILYFLLKKKNFNPYLNVINLLKLTGVVYWLCESYNLYIWIILKNATHLLPKKKWAWLFSFMRIYFANVFFLFVTLCSVWFFSVRIVPCTETANLSNGNSADDKARGFQQIQTYKWVISQTYIYNIQTSVVYNVRLLTQVLVLWINIFITEINKNNNHISKEN